MIKDVMPVHFIEVRAKEQGGNKYQIDAAVKVI